MESLLAAATESLLAAATESLLRRSCADQLCRAHSARRDATRRMRPAFIFPRVPFRFQWSWPAVLGQPPGPVSLDGKNQKQYRTSEKQ